MREAKAVPRPGEVSERAFLVGIEYRTRRRGGNSALTAGAQAARDGAALPTTSVAPRVPEFSAEESLDELKTLATSAGAEIAGEFLQRRDRPDPATLIGKGKLEEIAGAAASVDADLILFDHDLTASQQRNIERAINRRVIDRTQLILDIFAKHARTREGQLQVELAQLEYMLPRLAGRGIEMSQLAEVLERADQAKRSSKPIAGKSIGAFATSKNSSKMCGAFVRSSDSGGNRCQWRRLRSSATPMRGNRRFSIR